MLPIKRSTPQRPVRRIRPRLFTPAPIVVPQGAMPTVTSVARRPLPRRQVSPQFITPSIWKFTAPASAEGAKWPRITRPGSRIVAGAASTPAGIAPAVTRGKLHRHKLRGVRAQVIIAPASGVSSLATVLVTAYVRDGIVRGIDR